MRIVMTGAHRSAPSSDVGIVASYIFGSAPSHGAICDHRRPFGVDLAGHRGMSAGHWSRRLASCVNCIANAVGKPVSIDIRSTVCSSLPLT